MTLREAYKRGYLAAKRRLLESPETINQDKLQDMILDMLERSYSHVGNICDAPKSSPIICANQYVPDRIDKTFAIHVSNYFKQLHITQNGLLKDDKYAIEDAISDAVDEFLENHLATNRDSEFLEDFSQCLYDNIMDDIYHLLETPAKESPDYPEFQFPIQYQK